MKFSIGIPAFKSTYFEKCINSILDQTFGDFELIIVNDASPDPIKAIVDSYMLRDKRIHYFENQLNIGALNVVDNWNKCLKYATGEFFILMGDDDMLSPDYLKEILILIEKYPLLNVYHCRTIIINENSEPIFMTPAWPEYESVWESIYHRIRGYRYQFISDFCFNTLDLLNKGGFFKNPLAWASDDITVYKAEESLGIANTNNPVFLYRKNSQNISSTGSIDIMLDAIDKEVQWLYSFVIEHVPNNTKDEYIKSQILSYLPRYIYKKKSMTLSGEYSSGVLKGIFKNCRRLYKNNLNIKHLFISIALYLKDD